MTPIDGFPGDRLTDARGTLSRALAIDRTAFAPIAAIRAAAGVAIPVLIGAASGHLTEGSIAAAGALPTGTAGLGGSDLGSRARSGVIAGCAAGMTISTFVGGLVAGHLGPTLGVLVVWGFVAGLVVVLGREATVVSTQAVVGLVVFGRFPGSVSSSTVHAGYVLAGGALQGLLALLFRSPRRLSAERRALSHVFASLAREAHDLSRPSPEIGEALAVVDALVARRSTSDETGLLRGLVDEAGRVRLELQSLETVATIDGVHDVAIAAAAWLRRISQALRAQAAPPDESPDLSATVDRLRIAREDPAAPVRARYAASRAVALLGQLRAIDRQAAAVAGVRRFTLTPRLGATTVLSVPSRATGGLRRVIATARTPSSAAFRHAVRLAIALPAAEALSRALPGQRGYWVTLTAMLVLRPDYAATMQRGISRMAGTLLGVVLAGLIVVAAHPSGVASTILVAVFAWAAYASFLASYALYSFAITCLVVLLLSPTGGNDLSTVGDRGLDTVIGGLLALLIYSAWPTRESDTLDAAVGKVFAALADYTSELLTAYVEGKEPPADLRRAAAVARTRRVEATASLERARAEPARYRVDLSRAESLLSVARRIVIALHAMRAVIEDTDEHVAEPEVAAIRDAAVRALRTVASGNAPADVQDLREFQQVLADAARDPTTLHDRRLAVMAAHLDPLVDSIDTAAHICAMARSVAGPTEPADRLA